MKSTLSSATAAALLASTLVGSTYATTPLKLQFEIHRGDSWDSLSIDNEPYVYKRATGDGDVEMKVGNELFMYIATLKVGSNDQEVTVQVDTGSSDLWFMSKDVECFIPPENGLRRKRLVNPSRTIEDVKPQEKRFDYESFLYESFYYPSYETQTEFSPPTTLGDAQQTGNSPGDVAPSNTCVLYGSFETSESSSFKRNDSAPDFFISYGDLTGALGIWGHDTIKLDGEQVDDLSFAVANQSTTNIGILGIGLTGNEVTNAYGDVYQYLNLPAKLKADGIINTIAYSLYLNGDDARTGTVLFGAVDHAKYTGQLTTVPVLNITDSPNSLMVPLNGIRITNGKDTFDVSQNTYPALLDSGTSLSYFPSSLFSALATMLGGSQDFSGEIQIPCPKSDTAATVEFNIAGATIQVPLTSFVITGTGGGNTCFLGISESQDDYIIFGDNFLRNGYFVYDLENFTVSLAQAKFTNDENIEAISSNIPSAVTGSGYSNTAFKTFNDETATQTITYATGKFKMPDTPSDTVVSDGETNAPSPTKTGSSSGGKSSSSSKLTITKAFVCTMFALLSFVVLM